MNSAIVIISFAKLGINITKDVRAIKTAYTSLAKTIDRETEQSKFDDLHSAYRMALEYAKQSEQVVVGNLKIDFGYDSKPKNTPAETPKNENEFDFSSVKDAKKPENAPIESPKNENEFDFSSIKDVKKPEDTPAETSKNENEFDFSGVIDDTLSANASEIVDLINSYREKNGLNREEVVNRISPTKAVQFAYDLTFLYDRLSSASDDPLVWDVFKTELVIERVAASYDFREFLCEFKPADSKAFEILNEFCKEIEEQLQKNREIAKNEVLAITDARDKSVVYRKRIGIGAGMMLLSIVVLLLGLSIKDLFGITGDILPLLELGSLRGLEITGTVITIISACMFFIGLGIIILSAIGVLKLGDKYEV